MYSKSIFAFCIANMLNFYSAFYIIYFKNLSLLNLLLSKIITNENSIVKVDIHKKYNRLFIDFVSTNLLNIIITNG